MKRLIPLFLLVHSLAALAQTVGTLPTIYRVSQIIPPAHAQSGCNWMTGLRTGGLPCYDDESYIVAVASLGTVSNPIEIVFDVSIGIGSPIYLPAAPDVTLTGLNPHDTGIVVLPGSNATAICNKYPGYRAGCGGDTAGFAMPATAGAVVIQHLGINGNRGTYPNGNSTATDARCTNWCLGISVANLQFYGTVDLQIYDAPTYGSLSANIDREVHRGDRIVSPSLAVNTDGIHKDGPFGTYSISDTYLSTGDDGIAINLPEGYGGSGGAGTISDILYVNALACMRLYANNGAGSWTLGPVVATNLNGSLNGNGIGVPGCIRIGYGSGSIASEVTSFHGSHISVTGSAYMFDIANNAGELICTSCTLSSQFTVEPWLNFSAPVTVGNYVCATCAMIGTPAGAANSPWGVIPSGAAVTRLEHNGSATISPFAPVPWAYDVQSGGSIGTFVMTAMDPANIVSFLNGNEWSRIGNFYGAGVPGYFRNTTYAKLPPPTFGGLSASITDSAAAGVWGAVETGGSAGHYAQLTSNGTNWTVTGK